MFTAGDAVAASLRFFVRPVHGAEGILLPLVWASLISWVARDLRWSLPGLGALSLIHSGTRHSSASVVVPEVSVGGQTRSMVRSSCLWVVRACKYCTECLCCCFVSFVVWFVKDGAHPTLGSPLLAAGRTHGKDYRNVPAAAQSSYSGDPPCSPTKASATGNS